MSATLDRLLQLQERDREIAELTREAADIPGRKAAWEARLQEASQALQAHKEQLKKDTAATRQLEGEVEAWKEKIAKLRQQQYEVKTNEGYRALENEILAAQKEIERLEDQELQILEEMESLRGSVASEEKELQVLEAEVRREKEALDRRAQEIELRIQALRTERAGLAAEVENETLALYERILRHVGDFAVVPIENEACGGCHMRLTTQLTHDVRKGLRIVRCPYCQRILYWRP